MPSACVSNAPLPARVGSELYIDPVVIAWLQPGAVVRQRISPDDNARLELVHIRAVVDSEYIVFRQWKRGRWRYSVEWIYSFQLLYADGRLSLHRRAG